MESMGDAKYRQVGVVDLVCGDDVTIIEPSNIYGCSLGDGVFVGPFVVSIGEDCFISHGVMFINDTFRSGGPAGGDQEKWKQTRIGDRVSIGTNATVLPVNICDDVVIGAGSVVTSDVEKSGIYAGNPARWLREI